MKPTLFYIHGLGSDATARKFLNLKDFFKDRFNYNFFEWDTTSNIQNIIKKVIINLKDINELIIIGDSTGANFAYQLREDRNNINDILIMTSPLLDISKVSINFPNELKDYLKSITNPNNALIIASSKDDVIDQEYLFNTSFEKVDIINVDDDHRLKNFESYIYIIEDFINNKSQ